MMEADQDGLQSSLWGVFDSICFLVDAKTTVLEGVANPIGSLKDSFRTVSIGLSLIFGILNFANDIYSMYKATDGNQKKTALAAAISFVMLAATIGVSLVMPGAVGILAIIVNVGYVACMAVTLNLIKAILFDLIIMAIRTFRRLFYMEIASL